MKVLSILWLSLWPTLLVASPVEERATSAAVCNNAQAKALISSKATCYCSSYLKIPTSTVTKTSTRTSTILSTVTEYARATGVSTKKVTSIVSVRTVAADPKTTVITVTRTTTATPGVTIRGLIQGRGELVDREASSKCAIPSVVRTMSKAAISSACRCLSIATPKVTITKTMNLIVTRVSTQRVTTVTHRTTTVISRIIATINTTPTSLSITTVVITVTSSTTPASSSSSSKRSTSSNTAAADTKLASTTSLMSSTFQTSIRTSRSSSITSKTSTTSKKSSSSTKSSTTTSKMAVSETTTTTTYSTGPLYTPNVACPTKPASGVSDFASSFMEKRDAVESETSDSSDAAPPAGNSTSDTLDPATSTATSDGGVSVTYSGVSSNSTADPGNSTSSSASPVSSRVSVPSFTPNSTSQNTDPSSSAYSTGSSSNSSSNSSSKTSNIASSGSFPSNKSTTASTMSKGPSISSKTSTTASNTSSTSKTLTALPTPFTLQVVCSDLQISGLYALLYPYEDNATLQFVRNSNLASAFTISECGALVTSNFTANTDTGAPAMDLFFGDDDYMEDMDPVTVECSVVNGVLACEADVAKTLVWCDGEGTVMMVQSVPTGCAKVDFLVDYM